MLSQRRSTDSFQVCRHLLLPSLLALMIAIVSAGCAANATKRRALSGHVEPVVKWKRDIPYVDSDSEKMRQGADGTLYLSSGHELYALDSNGETKWQFHNGNEFGVAFGKDGTIYTGEETIYALALDGTIKRKMKPAVKAGNLAVGDDGTVYYDEHLDEYDDFGVDRESFTSNTLHAMSKTGAEKWSYKTKGYYSSGFAIGDDGRIYVATYNLLGPQSLATLRPDGTLDAWQVSGFGLFERNEWPSERYEPIIRRDKTVYVHCSKGSTATLSSNGKKVWESNVAGHGVAAIANDGTVYTVSELDQLITAFDSKGKRKWAFSGKGELPYLAIAQNGILYLTNCYSPHGSWDDGDRENWLYAVNPDGTERWSMKEEDGNTNPPLVGLDGTVYFLSGTVVTAISESR